MGAYNARGFIENGRYLDEKLVKEIGREGPLFWGTGESPLPYCRLEDGTILHGDDFPMVGITPLEAEAFATSLGVELPTWEEWQAAACPTNRLRRYPWKELSEGRLCAHLKALDLKDSPFAGAKRARWYRSDDSLIPGFHPVEVSFNVSDALGNAVIQKLDFRNELFHMIGNVGEIVRYNKNANGSWEYRVAGGDFTVKYDLVSIQHNEANPREVRTPNVHTGFRMVAPADETFARLLRDP